MELISCPPVKDIAVAVSVDSTTPDIDFGFADVDGNLLFVRTKPYSLQRDPIQPGRFIIEAVEAVGTVKADVEVDAVDTSPTVQEDRPRRIVRIIIDPLSRMGSFGTLEFVEEPEEQSEGI